MRAVVLNCSLKKSPEPSNTHMLTQVVVDRLDAEGIASTTYRLTDLAIPPGVSTDLGDGDPWPRLHDAILDAEILVFATPTWLGRPSSVAQRALERMDGFLSETDDDGRPVAYNRVAGVVVTGNEDGTHHVISEIAGALGDLGFTIPGQAWTYWNRGPGPGPEYSDTDEGHDWSPQDRTSHGSQPHLGRASPPSKPDQPPTPVNAALMIPDPARVSAPAGGPADRDGLPRTETSVARGSRQPARLTPPGGHEWRLAIAGTATHAHRGHRGNRKRRHQRGRTARQ